MGSIQINTNHLEQFGFRLRRGGAHLARTMMLEDLEALLAWVNDPQADRTIYARSVQDENCLGKRSAKTRKLTAKHLVALYGLDPSVAIFRNLLFFWGRDPKGHSLLALLCAYARDPLLRMSAPFILGLTEGTQVVREMLEAFIEDEAPDRFSKATLKSLAQNIDATWTKSGHLRGGRNKVRVRADATPGAVSYALFLGYLNGLRGPSLFQSEYARLLDCSVDDGIALAEQASRRGWVVFKRIGNVMEVQFPHLVTAKEMEWLREQG
jgi:hypothetical protein